MTILLRKLLGSICVLAAAGCAAPVDGGAEAAGEGTAPGENTAPAEAALTPYGTIAVTTPDRRNYTATGSGFTPGGLVHVTAVGFRAHAMFLSRTVTATSPSSFCTRTACWRFPGGALPATSWQMCEYPQLDEDIYVIASDQTTGMSSNAIVVHPSPCGQ